MFRTKKEKREIKKKCWKGECNWIWEWDLDDTSGMAETMASDIVSEDQVIFRRRYSVTLFDSHSLSLSLSATDHNSFSLYITNNETDAPNIYETFRSRERNGSNRLVKKITTFVRASTSQGTRRILPFPRLVQLRWLRHGCVLIFQITLPPFLVLSFDQLNLKSCQRQLSLDKVRRGRVTEVGK